MTRKALYPGSFDPFTAGHEAIVRRGLALFDKIYVAVGVNTDKQYMFSVEERLERIKKCFADEPRVETIDYSGMTVDLCHSMDIQFILRGIRDAKDLDYEQTIAAVNHALDPAIETVLLMADSEHRDISSTLVREQLSHRNT